MFAIFSTEMKCFRPKCLQYSAHFRLVVPGQSEGGAHILKMFQHIYSELELGPFLRPPKVSTTLTNLLTYWILLLARPVFFFFFSPASTLGVWPLTLPALAKEPCTFPPLSGTVRSRLWFSRKDTFTSSSSGEPEQNRLSCSASTPSRRESWALRASTL